MSTHELAWWRQLPARTRFLPFPGVTLEPAEHRAGGWIHGHATRGGPDAAPVVQYLKAVGDADLQPATLPLAAPDRDAIVGKYTYGSGARDYFTIDARHDMLGRDQLVVERPGAPSRQNLYHLGSLVFFPTGVPSAKVASPGTGRRSHS